MTLKGGDKVRAKKRIPLEWDLGYGWQGPNTELWAEEGAEGVVDHVDEECICVQFGNGLAEFSLSEYQNDLEVMA